jgi:tetratricopeptide (TPR) repeat protein
MTQGSTAPSRILIAAGAVLLALCAFTALRQQDVLAGTLAALALGSIALTVFAPRLGGKVEVGAKGVTFEVTRQAEQLSIEIGRRLDETGVSLADLASGQPINLPAETHADIARLLRAIDQLMNHLESPDGSGSPSESLEPAAQLELGRGLLAERRWKDAAAMLDRYVETLPGDWEAQFVRGVAHANTRASAASNLAALRAYNEALAFAPRGEAKSWLPRIYTYRGAMLKRLNRLEEAESDLLIARDVVTRRDEADDVKYNLAAVYAMTNRRDEAMALVRSLTATRFKDGISAHVDDYFANLRQDPEFIGLLDAA